MTVF